MTRGRRESDHSKPVRAVRRRGVRRIVAPATAILVALILVEVTFRIYLYGPGSLNYFKMNSVTHIWESGLVRPASHPEIFYELEPNRQAYFRMVRLETNSDGLVDREYSPSKPPNTLRVAVIGSSVTMPSATPAELAFHSVLEDRLNVSSADRRYEFINFAVEHYGFREMLAVLKHKALSYNPDLVLFSLTEYTPLVLWPQQSSRRSKFVPPDREYPFFELHSFIHLNHRFNLGLREALPDMRERATPEQAWKTQLPRALLELGRLRRKTDVPMAIVWLGYESWPSEIDEALRVTTERLGLALIDTSPAFVDERPSELVNFRADHHPNARAHGLFAGRILEGLEALGLLEPPP